jgi:hypothetical protein
MEFIITSTTATSQFNYKNVIIVQGSFVKNAMSGDLMSIHGDCYRKNAQGEQGEYIGYFDGTPNGSEIDYDLSKMNRSDSNLVWDAIDEIEPEILGENSED